MKERWVVFLFLLFLVDVVTADDYIHPFVAFCDHMGYYPQLKTNSSITSEIDGTCIFPDGNSCSLYNFYYNICGPEYQKEIRCRGVGETIFPNFETCCDGEEIYEPDYVFGQSICIEKKPVLDFLCSFSLFNNMCYPR